MGTNFRKNRAKQDPWTRSCQKNYAMTGFTPSCTENFLQFQQSKAINCWYGCQGAGKMKGRSVANRNEITKKTLKSMSRIFFSWNRSKKAIPTKFLPKFSSKLIHCTLTFEMPGVLWCLPGTEQFRTRTKVTKALWTGIIFKCPRASTVLFIPRGWNPVSFPVQKSIAYRHYKPMKKHIRV